MLARDGLQSGIRQPRLQRADRRGIPRERPTRECVDMVNRDLHPSTLPKPASRSVKQALLLEAPRPEAFQLSGEAPPQFFGRRRDLAI
jgi:hypothetical protein